MAFAGPCARLLLLALVVPAGAATLGGGLRSEVVAASGVAAPKAQLLEVKERVSHTSHLLDVPGSMTCSPTCLWKCEESECEQECEPKCQPPLCRTRCEGGDVDGCHMQCGKPECSVVCNSETHVCGSACSQAMCKLNCTTYQPCVNECEEPECEWHCRAPDVCPKPKCQLLCQNPKICASDEVLTKSLPALGPGELAVHSFEDPEDPEDPEELALAQAHGQVPAGARGRRRKVTAPVYFMNEERTLHQRKVQLPVGPPPQRRVRASADPPRQHP